MCKFGLSLLFLIFCLSANAQVTYTEQIQKSEQGEGTLKLHQSKKITDLVNGTNASATVTTGKKTPSAGVQPIQPSTTLNGDIASSNEPSVKQNGTKMRVNGYRIQVYSGDNTRKGKTEATMMGQRVRNQFTDLPVYTLFSSPHWICRVGDFRTYEEANEYFQQMKATGNFEEAVIVRSKVTIYY